MFRVSGSGFRIERSFHVSRISHPVSRFPFPVSMISFLLFIFHSSTAPSVRSIHIRRLPRPHADGNLPQSVPGVPLRFTPGYKQDAALRLKVKSLWSRDRPLSHSPFLPLVSSSHPSHPSRQFLNKHLQLGYAVTFCLLDMFLTGCKFKARVIQFQGII